MQPPMIAAIDTPFAGLTPDAVLDAAEALGLCPDGRLFALNSYENRVYRLGREEASRHGGVFRRATGRGRLASEVRARQGGQAGR